MASGLDQDRGSGLIGVHAGYDQQFGQFVVGAVGDIEWIGGSGTSDVFGRAEKTYARAAPNWQGSLRLKAGVPSGNFFVYAAGGLAVANYELDYTCCGHPFDFGDSFKKTLTGYTVGVWRHVCFQRTLERLG